MSNFIPQPYKKDPITIRLSPEKLDKIDTLAASYDMSRSEFINQCIDFAIKSMEEENSK